MLLFFVPLFLKFRGVGIQLPPGSHCASKQTRRFSDVFVKSCWYFQFLTHYFLFVVISTPFSSGTFQVIILLKLLKNCKIISIIKPYFHHSKLYNNPPFVYRPFPEKGGPHKYQHPWAEYQGGYSSFASGFFPSVLYACLVFTTCLFWVFPDGEMIKKDQAFKFSQTSRLGTLIVEVSQKEFQN